MQGLSALVSLVILLVALRGSDAGVFSSLFGGGGGEAEVGYTDPDAGRRELHSSPKDKEIRRDLGMNESARAALAATEDGGDDQFMCPDGRKLPISSVNDDFCDCGIDEPGTTACSGYESTAAMDTDTGDGDGDGAGEAQGFTCRNEGHHPETIAASRVDDGVCDCCDGSDEGRWVTCKDTCGEYAAAAEAIKQGHREVFNAGALVAQDIMIGVNRDVTTAWTFNKEYQNKAAKLRADVQAVDRFIDAEKRMLKKTLTGLRETALVALRPLLGLSNEGDTANLNNDDLQELLQSLLSVLGQDQNQAKALLVAAIGEEEKKGGEEKDVEEDEIADVDADGEEVGGGGGDDDDIFEAEISDNGSASVAAVEDVSQPSLDVSALLHGDPDKASLFLLHILETKRPFHVLTGLLGYQRSHGSFGPTAETYASKHHDSVKDESLCGKSLVELTNPADLEYICGIPRELEVVFEPIETAKEKSSEEKDPESFRSKKMTEMSELGDEMFKHDKIIHAFNVYKKMEAEAFLGLHDDCFSMPKGKYEYTVCFGDKVSQKDKESNVITSLGNFELKDSKADTKTGAIKFRFTEGTHCWNHGPRVTNVDVTCGAETALQTVAEPSTCVYEIEMISPAACNEAVAKHWGIA